MNHPRFRLLAGLLISALSLHDLGGATMVVEPVADVELRSGSPSTVVIGHPLVAGGLGDNVMNEWRRALMRFDLSGIPREAVVVDASLQVQVTRVPLAPADSLFELRRILVPWLENGASWNNRGPGQPWTVPGALDEKDVVATASSTVLVSGLGPHVYPGTLTFVEDVQDWVSDPTTNEGWLMRSQAETTLRTARHFGSREALLAGDRPRLTVTYGVPPVLEEVRRVGDGIGFRFTAHAGEIYRVETRPLLNAGTWGLTRRIGPFAGDQTVEEQEPAPEGGGSFFVRLVVETGAPVPAGGD